MFQVDHLGNRIGRDFKLDLTNKSEFLSVCCGAPPLGEIEVGICSRCKDHATFESEEVK
jgi:hypothetical protein